MEKKEYLDKEHLEALRSGKNEAVNAGKAAAEKESKEKGKKQIPLRLSASMYQEIAAWAEDEFRSVNGQIEYLLNECIRQHKKGKKTQSE